MVTIVSRHGVRVFDLLGTRPYRRGDGSSVQLADWRGTCVLCGVPFVVSTPKDGAAAAAAKQKAFQTVHCPDHRRRTSEAAKERNIELVARYGLSRAVTRDSAPCL
jgi:hypothetical protein